MDCTGRARQECLVALEKCEWCPDGAVLQLMSGGTDPLQDFRSEWLAELGEQRAICSGLTAVEAASPCSDGDDIRSASKDKRPLLFRKFVWEVCTQGLLATEDLQALWKTCPAHAGIVIPHLAGKALPARARVLEVAVRYLTMQGHLVAMAARQVYAGWSATGLAAWPPRTLQDAKIASRLVSLDVDCLSLRQLLSALPQMHALQFLRVWSVVEAWSVVEGSLGESRAESIDWPSALRAVAVPACVLGCMEGRAPSRLLVLFRTKEDTGFMAQESLKRAAQSGGVEELHLIDTSHLGSLTLKAMFGKGGVLRGAPLRRFLLHRSSREEIEGFLCALKVALPCIEEVYAAYSDMRRLHFHQGELESLLDKDQSTLRRLALSSRVWLSRYDSPKRTLTDLRLQLPHEYNCGLTCPVGVDDWSWTSFGSGSPLCPPSASDPLSYSESFQICQ